MPRRSEVLRPDEDLTNGQSKKRRLVFATLRRASVAFRTAISGLRRYRILHSPGRCVKQAMEDPRVDIVVRGMGERTFVEVVRALAADSPLQNILGIHYRDGGKIASTPDRPLEDINNFSPPSYGLIKPKRYVREVPGGGRQASTIFSRGCRFACDFSLDSKSRWLGLSIHRMIDDLEFWVGHGANRVLFYDGNFFLGRTRLIEFCAALLAATMMFYPVLANSPAK